MKQLLFALCLLISLVGRAQTPLTIPVRQGNTTPIFFSFQSAGTMLTPTSSLSMTAELREYAAGPILRTLVMAQIDSSASLKIVLPDLRPNTYNLTVLLKYANGNVFRSGLCYVQVYSAGEIMAIPDASGINVTLDMRTNVLNLQLGAGPVMNMVQSYVDEVNRARDAVLGIDATVGPIGQQVAADRVLAQQARSRADSSATAAGFARSGAEQARDQAQGHATSAGASSTSANTSATNAASSATSANTSKNAANTSATSASTSAGQAASSATQAATSAGNALASEQAAAGHKNAAATSATSASTSAGQSLASANNASTSESNALASKNAAGTSETNAQAYRNQANTAATNAATSASSASVSAGQSAASATQAGNSATTAGQSEASALVSKNAAATSEGNALTYRNAANTSATSASTSAGQAANSATQAGTSATNAATSEGNAQTYRNQAQSARDAAVSAVQNVTVNLGNISTSATIDMSQAANTFVYGTLVGNTTLTITGVGPGRSLYMELIQGGAGGYTATFPASVRFPAGSTVDWNSTAGTYNAFSLVGRPSQGGFTLTGFYSKQ